MVMSSSFVKVLGEWRPGLSPGLPEFEKDGRAGYSPQRDTRIIEGKWSEHYLTRQRVSN